MSLPATEMLVGSFLTKTARIASIRDMALNIQTETKSDDEINKTAVRKDRKVFNLTGKSDWVDTDEKFPLVVDASNCYTAIEILMGIATPDALSNAAALQIKADDLIKEINDESTLMVNSETVTTEGIGGENNGTFM